MWGQHMPEPKTVKLIDGREVPSDSKEWRSECLARDKHVQAILRMVGRQYRGAREAYCANVGMREGAEAERRLRGRVRAVWPKGMDK